MQNMHHWYRAYGGWSFAMKSYWELNITKNVDTANMQKLANIIDPYGMLSVWSCTHTHVVILLNKGCSEMCMQLLQR